jgi:HTH-type transcriptional regulator, global nitrogen regulator NrpRI
MKDEKKQTRLRICLNILSHINKPMGATRLAAEFGNLGIDLSDRTVRLLLEELDKQGLTKNLGRRGRRLTARGFEIASANISASLRGFVNVKAETLASQMTFSLSRRRGSIVLNLSLIPQKYMPMAVEEILKAYDAGISFGELIAIGMPGEILAGQSVPDNHIAIGTVCGITANGIFLQAGIPTTSIFGGLLEINEGKPRYFQHIIHYNGTTIDPLEIFMRGEMTSTSEVSRGRHGLIGAGFREVPATCLPKLMRFEEHLNRAKLKGIIAIGKPGHPLAATQVTRGRAGVIVQAGLNPIAAAQEKHIPIKSFAMSRLYPYEKLVHYTELEKFRT